MFWLRILRLVYLNSLLHATKRQRMDDGEHTEHTHTVTQTHTLYSIHLCQLFLWAKVNFEFQTAYDVIIKRKGKLTICQTLVTYFDKLCIRHSMEYCFSIMVYGNKYENLLNYGRTTTQKWAIAKVIAENDVRLQSSGLCGVFYSVLLFLKVALKIF